MAQHRLDISVLDFENIKGSLKRFLSNQNEFKDYDFEGSSLSILLDLLSYNTHYLAYNANFVANEMYLDTAQLRSSVASLAKLVGYTPNSARAPIADLKLVINDGTGSTITIPAGTKFSSPVDLRARRSCRRHPEWLPPSGRSRPPHPPAARRDRSR